jgi:hypothetical protein
MDEKKSIFQNGFLVLKNYISRAIAASLSLLALLLLFYLSTNVLYDVFDVKLYLPNVTASFSESSFFSTAVWVLICYLIFIPYETGVRHWFYRVSSEQYPPFMFVFYYFSSAKWYFRALWIRFRLEVRKCFWWILFLMPSILLKLTLDYPDGPQKGAAGVLYGVIYGLFVLSLFGGVLGAFYFNLRYYLVYYLWFEHPEQKLKILVRQSVEMMKDHRTEMIPLCLVLLLLALFSVFVLPILVFIPAFYILTSLQARGLLSQFYGKEV